MTPPSNDIDSVRAEIDRWFDPSAIVLDERKTDVSPSGRYALVVHSYRQRKPDVNWSICEVAVVDDLIESEVLRFKCDDERFFHGWAARDGREYLLCSEALGGQTVIDLNARVIASYYDPDDPFIWTEFHPSRDGARLAVIGCYWASGHDEAVVYDFTDPLALPLRVVSWETIEHREKGEWLRRFEEEGR